jgi:hypothetical protein
MYIILGMKTRDEKDRRDGFGVATSLGIHQLT